MPNSIGLSMLPIQKRLYALKKGVNFTMMLVGESGVGKTSFINTLFDTLAIKPTAEFKPSPDKTTEIVPHKMEFEEEGFDLRLTIIDTPGFGDFIDNRYCWYPIVRYIDEQYRRVVYQECQPDRSNMTHGEVHACLYFIVPTATGLSQIDLEAMKNFSIRVNLIPVIAKADAFTRDEVNTFKEVVRKTLKEHSISICELIDQDSVADFIPEMPFSIINSAGRFEKEDGKTVRGRKYSWGLAEVENPKHCDFLKLRDFLMGQHLSELITSTESYHDNYRRDFMKYRLES
ncbi:unnamed protein product [Ambrosiozyma monospora]|uniref:Unnamed protein product n=1 Tax=Ambrosiozyma monospora TaxID=43982 RepID=A0ACB5TYV4_AMBMO|nr:unnamed protein product [Ambrosiozyma monospora]